MKTIAFRDIAGVPINYYFRQGETRIERFENALKELRHVGRINVYLIDGNKTRFLFSKGY